MDREGVKNHSTAPSNGNGDRNGNGPSRKPPSRTTSSDYFLQWGNRKRLRCMKIQVKDDSAPVQKTTVRVDRRVVRSDYKDSSPTTNHPATATTNTADQAYGYINLRQRLPSPSPSPAPPPPSSIHFNLRHRPSSPSAPPLLPRLLRYSKGRRSLDLFLTWRATKQTGPKIHVDFAALLIGFAVNQKLEWWLVLVDLIRGYYWGRCAVTG